MSGPRIIYTEWWLERSVVSRPVRTFTGASAFFRGGFLKFAVVVSNVLAAEGVYKNPLTNTLW
jgi:hypothetical protein